MLAVHDTGYPRNASIRRRFEEAGHDVQVIAFPIEKTGYFARAKLLARQAKAVVHDGFPPDVVWLAEFSAQFTPLARWIATKHRAVFVHDFFVGLYETNVEDWAQIEAGSLRARLHRSMDVLAAIAPDIVVRDTQPRAEAIPRLTRSAAMVLPVEAPAWVQPPQHHETSASEPRILFYGNYIPLHGTEIIIEAFRQLDTSVTMIGSGSARLKLEKDAPENIEFLDSMSADRLASYLDAANIVLGVFGVSSKAGSVIPNKVLQGLAAGKVVITRESRAYLSMPSYILETQLVQVAPGSSDALAQAVSKVISDGRFATPFPNSSATLQEWIDSYWLELLAAVEDQVGSRRRTP